jgi:hypothetical protein
MKALWRATMIGVALSWVATLFPSAVLTYPSVLPPILADTRFAARSTGQ